MTDLDYLLGEIHDGAEQRGLPIVDATFPGEPTFALHVESTPVEEVLDLAQRMLAPFISVTVDAFDADEFLAEFDEEVPTKVVKLAREHHGQLQGLAVRWFGLGATALFLAGTDWSDDLSEFQDDWAVEQQTAWVDARDNRSIRVAHLADHIELDPRYRAAGQNQRTVVGRLVADELRSTDDDATTVRWALERASRSVRDNAAAQYLPLEGQMEQMAEELRVTDEWGAARSAKARDETARAFLLELTGYASTAVLAERLARLAFTGR